MVSPILGRPLIEHDNRGFANRGNTLKINSSSKFDNLFIERFGYHQIAGKEVRFFDITKDGFTLLTRGFTGQKAIAFKIA